MIPEQIEKEIWAKAVEIDEKSQNAFSMVVDIAQILREAYEDKCRAVSKAIDVGLILHTEYLAGTKSLEQIGKDESEYLKSILLHTNP